MGSKRAYRLKCPICRQPATIVADEIIPLDHSVVSVDQDGQPIPSRPNDPDCHRISLECPDCADLISCTVDVMLPKPLGAEMKRVRT